MAASLTAKQGRWGASMSIPGRSVVAVSPSDSADLPDGECRALYVTVAGNVVFIAADDSASVTWPVTAGQIIPVCVKRVLATNTTATVHAIY